MDSGEKIRRGAATDGARRTAHSAHTQRMRNKTAYYCASGAHGGNRASDWTREEMENMIDGFIWTGVGSEEGKREKEKK